MSYAMCSSIVRVLQVFFKSDVCVCGGGGGGGYCDMYTRN